MVLPVLRVVSPLVLMFSLTHCTLATSSLRTRVVVCLGSRRPRSFTKNSKTRVHVGVYTTDFLLYSCKVRLYSLICWFVSGPGDERKYHRTHGGGSLTGVVRPKLGGDLTFEEPSSSTEESYREPVLELFF